MKVYEAAMALDLGPLVFVLALGVSTTACDDSVVDPCAPKGEIDRGALQLGATVDLAGDIGLTYVPFIVPIPEGDDATLEAEMQGAVSLIVTNTNTGITVDLTSGMLFDPPEAPGQWVWKMQGGRDEVAMMFYNASIDGRSLSSSGVYQATLSISYNNFIEEEVSFAYPVYIVEN